MIFDGLNLLKWTISCSILGMWPTQNPKNWQGLVPFVTHVLGEASRFYFTQFTVQGVLTEQTKSYEDSVEEAFRERMEGSVVLDIVWKMHCQ